MLPERRDDDTLREIPREAARGRESKRDSCVPVSKGTDTFSQSDPAELHAWISRFTETPWIWPSRKLLMEAELPTRRSRLTGVCKHSRTRYHECNPGIYSTPDQAYFIASLSPDLAHGCFQQEQQAQDAENRLSEEHQGRRHLRRDPQRSSMITSRTRPSSTSKMTWTSIARRFMCPPQG